MGDVHSRYRIRPQLVSLADSIDDLERAVEGGNFKDSCACHGVSRYRVLEDSCLEYLQFATEKRQLRCLKLHELLPGPSGEPQVVWTNEPGDDPDVIFVHPWADRANSATRLCWSIGIGGNAMSP